MQNTRNKHISFRLNLTKPTLSARIVGAFAQLLLFVLQIAAQDAEQIKRHLSGVGRANAARFEFVLTSPGLSERIKAEMNDIGEVTDHKYYLCIWSQQGIFLHQEGLRSPTDESKAGINGYFQGVWQGEPWRVQKDTGNGAELTVWATNGPPSPNFPSRTNEMYLAVFSPLHLGIVGLVPGSLRWDGWNYSGSAFLRRGGASEPTLVQVSGKLTGDGNNKIRGHQFSYSGGPTGFYYQVEFDWSAGKVGGILPSKFVRRLIHPDRTTSSEQRWDIRNLSLVAGDADGAGICYTNIYTTNIYKLFLITNNSKLVFHGKGSWKPIQTQDNELEENTSTLWAVRLLLAAFIIAVSALLFRTVLRKRSNSSS